MESSGMLQNSGLLFTFKRSEDDDSDSVRWRDIFGRILMKRSYVYPGVLCQLLEGGFASLLYTLVVYALMLTYA